MSICLKIDTPNLEPLEPILDALEGKDVRMWVAPSAFISLGPSVVHHLRLAGFETFLDLRLTGEAESVARSIESVRRQRALGVTVDLSCGVKAVSAAKAAARGRVHIIGVAAPMDRPENSAAGLQVARESGLSAVYVHPDALAATEGFRDVYVRSERVLARAGHLVVCDRVLAAADPAEALDAIVAEWS